MAGFWTQPRVWCVYTRVWSVSPRHDPDTRTRTPRPGCGCLGMGCQAHVYTHHTLGCIQNPPLSRKKTPNNPKNPKTLGFLGCLPGRTQKTQKLQCLPFFATTCLLCWSRLCWSRLFWNSWVGLFVLAIFVFGCVEFTGACIRRGKHTLRPHYHRRVFWKKRKMILAVAHKHPFSIHLARYPLGTNETTIPPPPTHPPS